MCENYDRYVDGFKDGIRNGQRQLKEAFDFGYNIGLEHGKDQNEVLRHIKEQAEYEEFAGKQPDCDTFEAGYNAGYEQGAADFKSPATEEWKRKEEIRKYITALQLKLTNSFKHQDLNICWKIDELVKDFFGEFLSPLDCFCNDPVKEVKADYKDFEDLPF